MLSHLAFALSLMLLLTASSSGAARTVTDSAGREVMAPARIDRVYPAGPPASIFLYVLAPSLPFGWVDRPPSINRLIGIQWLTRLFDPSVDHSGGMREAAREFYRRFYHLRLSERQLDKMFEYAGLPAR